MRGCPPAGRAAPTACISTCPSLCLAQRSGYDVEQCKRKDEVPRPPFSTLTIWTCRQGRSERCFHGQRRGFEREQGRRQAGSEEAWTRRQAHRRRPTTLPGAWTPPTPCRLRARREARPKLRGEEKNTLCPWEPLSDPPRPTEAAAARPDRAESASPRPPAASAEPCHRGRRRRHTKAGSAPACAGRSGPSRTPEASHLGGPYRLEEQPPPPSPGPDSARTPFPAWTKFLPA